MAVFDVNARQRVEPRRHSAFHLASKSVEGQMQKQPYEAKIAINVCMSICLKECETKKNGPRKTNMSGREVK